MENIKENKDLKGKGKATTIEELENSRLSNEIIEEITNFSNQRFEEDIFSNQSNNDINGEGSNSSNSSSQALVFKTLETNLAKSKSELLLQIEELKNERELVVKEFESELNEKSFAVIKEFTKSFNLQGVNYSNYLTPFSVFQAYEGLSSYVDKSKRAREELQRVIQEFNLTVRSDVESLSNNFELIQQNSFTQLQYQHNNFLEILHSETEKKEAIITDLEDIIKDKDLIIESNEGTLNNFNIQIVELEEQIEVLKKELFEIKEKNKTNWKEIFKKKRKSIQSSEDFLNKSVEELQNTIEGLNKLLMDAENNNLSQEADILFLRNEIRSLEIKVRDFERKEQSNLRLFSQWEENKKQLKAGVQKHLDNYQTKCGENFLLNNENCELKIKVINLNKSISNQSNKINNLERELSEEKKSRRDLSDRLHKEINNFKDKLGERSIFSKTYDTVISEPVNYLKNYAGDWFSEKVWFIIYIALFLSNLFVFLTQATWKLFFTLTFTASLLIIKNFFSDVSIINNFLISFLIPITLYLSYYLIKWTIKFFIYVYERAKEKFSEKEEITL